MTEQLEGGRFLAITSIIRLNQIEVAHDRFIGEDEQDMVSLDNARRFRETIRARYPQGAITWAFSYGALTSGLAQFEQLRTYARDCAHMYGDDVTYVAGGFFANAYSSIDRVNAELDEAMALLEGIMGVGYRPKSVIAGFLSSANQQHLAQKHGIHVCQGTIWSQYSIDNQDGDGSVCYPYYPSREHFCKPAQGKDDFIDCVCLDGWSCDFVCARQNGAGWECNSRMGVGPIETIMTYGDDVGVAEQLATTACHFDDGYARNGFAYVPVIWELSLMHMHDGDCSALGDWLTRIVRRWPDSRLRSMGDIGLLWRAANPDNSRFDYRFEMGGSGIGGSHRYLRVKWYMNSTFRLALIKDMRNGSVRVIDFTVYSDPAAEPVSGTTRSWSLMGRINQKGVRPQDRPIPVSELSDEARAIIAGRGISLDELERFGA